MDCSEIGWDVDRCEDSIGVRNVRGKEDGVEWIVG